VSGRTVDAVKADIESRLQGIDIPFEYHMEVLSDSQGVQTNQQRLIAIAIAAVIGIYLLMQAAFSSWRLAFVVILTLPMALTGGVLAALLGGGVLSTGSLFGFFAVLAVAVRNGMVLISHLRHLGQNEDEGIEAELVLRGARERMTPILMTALATGLALTPLLFGGNIAGSEIIRPMAAVIIGGLVTSTLLNLFIVPALYLRWPSAVPAAADSQVGTQPAPAPEAAL
jgi:Cu/Ag efflux pump CusA